MNLHHPAPARILETEPPRITWYHEDRKQNSRTSPYKEHQLARKAGHGPTEAAAGPMYTHSLRQLMYSELLLNEVKSRRSRFNEFFMYAGK
jgi:hypothetical protein